MPFIIKLLLAVIILSVLGFCAMVIYDRFLHPATNQPSKAVEFNGYIIPISENVSKNELDPQLFYEEDGRMYYDDENVKYGIDVSSHQNDIDWKAVADSGVEFAIIRAGYRGYGSAGTVNADEYFEKNISGALENGIDVGVYFFSQAITEEEARQEAEFVLETISGYDITYPVIYDWEHMDNIETARTYDYSGLDVSAFANAFCSVISEAGYDTMVYFNPSYGYMIYDVEEINAHTFWLAEYKPLPDFYYEFIIWQYSNKGTVPGIEGNVDLNMSFIDLFKAEENE